MTTVMLPFYCMVSECVPTALIAQLEQIRAWISLAAMPHRWGAAMAEQTQWHATVPGQEHNAQMESAGGESSERVPTPSHAEDVSARQVRGTENPRQPREAVEEEAVARARAECQE